MRALVQRVTRASVSTEGRSVGSIGRGMVVLLGVARDDTEERAGKLWRKLRDLRMFDDERGRADLTLGDVGGSVLVVSQFTLYASVRRGRRPSYSDAAPGPQASALYEAFCALVRADLGDVQTGVFGADMQVSLVNDGPYTIWVDTDDIA